MRRTLAEVAEWGLTRLLDNTCWDDFLVYEQLEQEGKLKTHSTVVVLRCSLSLSRNVGFGAAQARASGVVALFHVVVRQDFSPVPQQDFPSKNALSGRCGKTEIAKDKPTNRRDRSFVVTGSGPAKTRS